MKTLLEALPAIAAKSQIRFAENFQDALSVSERKIATTTYFIHCYKDNGIRCFLTEKLCEVINTAKEYGKDCQVFQITEDGTVTEL